MPDLAWQQSFPELLDIVCDALHTLTVCIVKSGLVSVSMTGGSVVQQICFSFFSPWDFTRYSFRFCIFVLVVLSFLCACTRLGTVKLGQVGPAGHGIELGPGACQFQGSLTSVVRQGRGATLQHLDNLLCITLSACVVTV